MSEDYILLRFQGPKIMQENVAVLESRWMILGMDET